MIIWHSTVDNGSSESVDESRIVGVEKFLLSEDEQPSTEKKDKGPACGAMIENTCTMDHNK
jgi:hypothetical protein